MQLFCLPYSGASAMTYNKWKPFLREGVELCPLELAGRGIRGRLPLYQSIDEAIQDLVGEFRRVYSGGDFAFYGHSLGGLLCFELVHKLLEMGYPQPQRMFFSACRPPQHTKDEEVLHVKSDKDFMLSIMKLGGTPLALLNNQELLTYFAPIVKSDFRIYELYKYSEKKQLIACPVTVLLGSEDTITYNHETHLWDREFLATPNIFVLQDAGHFFIDDRTSEVLTCVNEHLEECLK